MRFSSIVAVPIVFTAVLLPAAEAQDSPPPAVEATSLEVQAPIEAVTVYRGRAAVTRRAELELDPGLWDLRFASLPGTVQPETLQAGATGPARVLGVEYEEVEMAVSDSPRLAELDEQIRRLKIELKQVKGLHEINKAKADFISAVGVRAAGDATKDGGTDELDLDVVRSQLAFLTEEHADHLAERQALDARSEELQERLHLLETQRNAISAGPDVARTAIVSVVVAQAGASQIELSYLVTSATWQPFYNVRASFQSGTVVVEYDAMLAQQTGEDWEDVRLTLSTSQPTIDANPPVLSPWFVDVLPEERYTGREVRRGEQLRAVAPEAARGGGAIFGDAEDELWEAYSADAEIGGAGPSITFQLPRPVTVHSHSDKRQRTRIASIDTQTDFVHVAIPLLTDAVYVRGELVNAGGYQLLPGRAAIFVGQDYVGPTRIEAVAPAGEFDLYFGIDPAVSAVRRMVGKKTSKTGLFSGGRRTDYQYRIEIKNGAGEEIELELWDRIPVSRSDQIRIELVGLSTPVSDDADYVAEDQPSGLLRWDLAIPAGAEGSGATVLTYGLRVNRARDVEMTPLPE